MSYYGQTEDPSCGCYIAEYLPWCIEAILIPQLSTGVSYRAEITDHFNNKHVVDNIAVVGGKGVLELADLPEGLFTPFGGAYILKVYTMADLTVPYNFVFGADTYNCILLKFQDMTPLVEEAEIL